MGWSIVCQDRTPYKSFPSNPAQVQDPSAKQLQQYEFGTGFDPDVPESKQSLIQRLVIYNASLRWKVCWFVLTRDGCGLGHRARISVRLGITADDSSYLRLFPFPLRLTRFRKAAGKIVGAHAYRH
jgi:hypothetical protein